MIIIITIYHYYYHFSLLLLPPTVSIVVFHSYVAVYWRVTSDILQQYGVFASLYSNHPKLGF